MLKNNLKKLFWGLVYFSGINFIYNKLFPVRLLLIGGHSVYSAENKKALNGELYADLSIDKGFLEKEIEYLLKNNYTFLNFGEIDEFLNRGEKLPQKSVVVYFDDGFRDIYLNAYPVFKKYNLPFVFFITIDFIEQKRSLPRIIERAEKSGIKISEKIFCNWEEIKEMSDLAEIGCHGVSHIDFVDLREVELKQELSMSIREIESNIGKKPVALSFPHGKYNQETKKTVRDMGLKFAVTTKRGWADPRDRFELKKIVIYPTDSFVFFKLKLGIYYKIIDLLK